MLKEPEFPFFFSLNKCSLFCYILHVLWNVDVLFKDLLGTYKDPEFTGSEEKSGYIILEIVNPNKLVMEVLHGHRTPAI